MTMMRSLIFTFILFITFFNLFGQALNDDPKAIDSVKIFMIQQFMLSEENLENLSNKINVIQNPSGNQLYVVFDENPEQEVFDIVITDIFNNIIILREIARQAEVIDISSLDKGTYIVRVISNNDLLIKEIVIRE